MIIFILIIIPISIITNIIMEKYKKKIIKKHEEITDFIKKL